MTITDPYDSVIQVSERRNSIMIVFPVRISIIQLLEKCGENKDLQKISPREPEKKGLVCVEVEVRRIDPNPFDYHVSSHYKSHSNDLSPRLFSAKSPDHYPAMRGPGNKTAGT
jgi:hypothetical protein